MGALQPVHLLVVLIIVLIVFGAGKLPEVGSGLAKGIREFKHATQEPDTSEDAGSAKVAQEPGSRCSRCGTAPQSGQRFCASCGAPLVVAGRHDMA